MIDSEGVQYANASMRLKDAPKTIGNTPFKPTRETAITEQIGMNQIKAVENELERRLSPKAPENIALHTPAEQAALDALNAQKKKGVLERRDKVLKNAGLPNFNNPKLNNGK